MYKFFSWLDNRGWHTVLAVVYALICIFDFIIVPSWIGMTRLGIIETLQAIDFQSLSPEIQRQIIEKFTYQHEPFTLKGGGLIHLAFGALLTGSAMTGKTPELPKE